MPKYVHKTKIIFYKPCKMPINTQFTLLMG